MEFTLKLQKRQLEAFKKSLDTPVLFYGGAKGGGKSYFVRAREVYRRLKHPGTAGLILRRTYPELRSNHILKFFEEYPQTRQWYKKADKAIYWPTGSITEFSYLKNEGDVYNFQGREFEDISIDEATQHREEDFKILRSSNRSANEEFRKNNGRPTMVLTGNPGGVGHAWVKRLFIDKDYTANETPEDFEFIQAFVHDNKKLIENDPDYLKRLQALPDHLRRAYLEGDWNIHAGMAFSELSERVHLIAPFELPKNTRYFAGYDHGFNHPYSFVLFGVVPDGTVYVIRHRTGRLKRPDEIAKEILKCVPIKDYGEVRIYAGHDLWSRQRDGGPTVYEQFLDAGISPKAGYYIIRANADRVQGVAQIRNYIAFRNTESGEPKMFFFNNCRDVYRVLTNMQFDMTRPEDVLKEDADSNGNGGDDPYDALRYGLMSRATPPKEEQRQLDPNTPYGLLQEHLRKKNLQRRLLKW